MTRSWVFFVTMVLPLISWGESQPAPASVPAAVATPQEAPAVSAEERMKVKKRLYPGGRDEEPLQVQSQLVTPTRAAVSADELPSDDAD